MHTPARITAMPGFKSVHVYECVEQRESQSWVPHNKICIVMRAPHPRESQHHTTPSLSLLSVSPPLHVSLSTPHPAPPSKYNPVFFAFNPAWRLPRRRRWRRRSPGRCRCVAVQVKNLKKQILKPGFHLLGARFETNWGTRRLSGVGQGESTCAAPTVGEVVVLPARLLRQLLRHPARHELVRGVAVQVENLKK